MKNIIIIFVLLIGCTTTKYVEYDNSVAIAACEVFYQNSITVEKPPKIDQETLKQIIYIMENYPDNKVKQGFTKLFQFYEINLKNAEFAFKMQTKYANCLKNGGRHEEE